MNAYLICYFIIGCLALALRLVALGCADYPRTVKHSRGDDVIALMVVIGLLVWNAILLFGR